MENNQSQKIHLTKKFAVSKNNLYKAWIDPSELKKWWRPLDKQLTNVTNDVTKGGKVEYKFEEDDLEINGVYKEAVENEKLVYTWNWILPENSINRGDYLLTVVFTGEGDTSTLEVTQENFEAGHAIQPHKDGWEKALQELNEHLSTKNV